MAQDRAPHYQVRLVDDTPTTASRSTSNRSSRPPTSNTSSPSAIEHPITRGRAPARWASRALESKPGTGALDYIRGNLFDRTTMRPLPFNVPGFDNDLNEKIDRVMQRAVADEAALVYAFGERWGPEPRTKDKYFGFLPGNGIHDIHMNQGNSDRFVGDDGVYQDGGLLIHFPDQQEWTAVFLKFQSQAGTPTTGRDTPSRRREPPGPPPAADDRRAGRSGAHRRGPRQRDAVARGGGRDASEHGAARRSAWRDGRCSTRRRSTLPLSGALGAGATPHRAYPAAAGALEQGRRDHAASTTRA